MKYCPQCYHLTENEKCDYCQFEEVRDVHDDDKCFLIERQLIWAEMLKERLEKAHIPYQCNGEMGSGMALKVGPYLENFSFYVPYCYYSSAKTIIDSMFVEQ